MKTQETLECIFKLTQPTFKHKCSQKFIFNVKTVDERENNKIKKTLSDILIDFKYYDDISACTNGYTASIVPKVMIFMFKATLPKVMPLKSVLMVQNIFNAIRTA